MFAVVSVFNTSYQCVSERETEQNLSLRQFFPLIMQTVIVGWMLSDSNIHMSYNQSALIIQVKLC